MRRLIVAITEAIGAIHGLRALELLRDIADIETHLRAAYRSGALVSMLAPRWAFYDRFCTGAEKAIAFDIINRSVLRTSSLRSRSMIPAACWAAIAHETNSALSSLRIAIVSHR